MNVNLGPTFDAFVAEMLESGLSGTCAKLWQIASIVSFWSIPTWWSIGQSPLLYRSFVSCMRLATCRLC